MFAHLVDKLHSRIEESIIYLTFGGLKAAPWHIGSDGIYTCFLDFLDLFFGEGGLVGRILVDDVQSMEDDISVVLVIEMIGCDAECAGQTPKNYKSQT
jgi:hypothetical protein